MIRGLLLVLLALTVAAPAHGHSARRDILALYDGSENPAPDMTQIHQALETPLNHMGYRLVYRELTQGLPPPDQLGGYKAVVAWFESDTTMEPDFFAAASAAIDAGVKWILVGDVGVQEDDIDDSAYQGFLARLGLSDPGDYVSVTYDAQIASINPEIYGFEAELSALLPPFPALSAASEEIAVHLAVTSPQIGHEAVLAATSPNGGYIASGYAMSYLEDLDRTAWLIDPFAFLSEALAETVWPVPDTTTLSGRRIYFSHMDGDGWVNGSAADGYQGTAAISADVILAEVIAAYPDLPVSVGLVAGDMVYAEQYAERVEETARAMFALPQVEVASHTMTHPFLWRQLGDYDRAAELEDLEQRRPPQGGGLASVLTVLGLLSREEFTPPPGDPWRYYSDTPYDVEEETAGALRVSEMLAPPGKAAELYLWSGDTSPDAEAIAAVRAAGAANMNGGDTRFDAIYPSLTYVAPLSRVVGVERQIYAVNSNENTYTNLWRGPFYGQMLLEETWERTGSPRRLRPQNLYYHTYAGERSDSLAALIHHLDLARAGTVTPIPASQYARIAEGFFSAEIVDLGSDRWRIENRGALQTLRFDPAPAQLPDYDASQGVIGHIVDQGALYVALDSEVDAALVTLSFDAVPRLALADARWQVWNVDRSGCGLSARIQGFGRPEMRWWAPEASYSVRISDGQGVVWQSELSTRDGVLTFNPDLEGYAPLTLEIACIDEVS